MGDNTPAVETDLAAARETAEQLARQADAGLLPTEAVGILREVQQLLARLGTEKGQSTLPQSALPQSAGRTLFFDVSDLLGYFPYNRLPTGIQRVQISIILNLMNKDDGWTITTCRFIERLNEWREVPASLFRSLCAMSLGGGDSEAPDWRAEYAKLEGATLAGGALLFPQAACLVNLGTSWWLPDYFSSIRQAKTLSGIRYVPLIHDMIPAIMPGFCDPELVHEFVDWIVGVLQHADFFLAVSEATKRDLISLAGSLGMALPETRVTVVPLASELNHVGPTDAWKRVALGRWGLKAGGYVLFVSTVEARKNQLGAFDAWQALLSAHGPDRVPTLVCVGKRGFESELALARLELSPGLRDRVLLLDNVDDAGLEALYRQCMFTVYPSLYEGWGLPVSESLAYGKVPVTADNSSLPQAGGGFSLLYETGSQASFVGLLEKMCFDTKFRQTQEARIAARFRVRTWQQVADDLRQAVLCVQDGSADLSPPWVIPIAVPGFYPLVRNRETGVRRGVGSAEVFRRGGSGWWRLEDFGAWTRPAGGELAMRLDADVKQIALALHGLPNLRSSYTVVTEEGVILASGELPANAARWLVLDLPVRHTVGPFVLHIASLQNETVIDPVTKKKREIGIGVGGFFVFDPTRPRARVDFVEAVALGSLDDYKIDVIGL